MLLPDHLDLEVKWSEPDETGTFEGFASVFSETDALGDQVAPGAFRKSLDGHRRRGRWPLMLYMHRQDEPIGVWTSIAETAQGLAVKGRLILDTVRGKEVYALLKERAISGLSIGYRTVKSARTRTGRILEEIALEEISLVAMPALASARVHSVKSKDPTMSLELSVPTTDDTAAAPEDQLEQRMAEIETKVAPVAELATRLDKIETRLSRPSARIEVKEDREALETKAFTSWARRGIEGLSDLEKKILSVSLGGSPTDSTGFQLVPETFLRELIRNLVLISPMRQVARVQTVSGGPVLVPKRTGTLTGAWVAERAEHALSQPSYDQQSVGIFEARVSIEVSNQLLEDAAFDLANELARDLAEEFARLEGEAFVSGNGTSQPEGFLASDDFDTTGTTGAVTADSIIDLFHKVPSIYAGNGTWLMNRSTMGTVRKLKTTGTGVYLWADSLVPGNPPTILGRPVVEMPGMASTGFSPNHVAVAFGDWNRAYRIFDRVGLEVLRDPFSLARSSLVCFHARRRVGAALVDGEAVHGLVG